MRSLSDAKKIRRVGLALLVVGGTILAFWFLPSRSRQPRQSAKTKEQISASIRALRSEAEPKARQARLHELRRTLAASPAPQRGALIQQLLDAREDAPTGLDLTVGKDGFLQQPSTFRVWLLDELGKTDPQAAAAYAEKILASKDSPDEWAVSLRNYALGKTNEHARNFLQQKFREMARHVPWQKQPSAGFLEAFDVAVHAGGTECTPRPDRTLPPERK